jgi:hypothetical protein
MHKNDDLDCLFFVITAQEAAQLWGLSRNAVSDACRRGALRARRSGKTWLVTIEDMLHYQRGRYWTDAFPSELTPALERAIAQREKCEWSYIRAN